MLECEVSDKKKGIQASSDLLRGLPDVESAMLAVAAGFPVPSASRMLGEVLQQQGFSASRLNWRSPLSRRHLLTQCLEVYSGSSTAMLRC